MSTATKVGYLSTAASGIIKTGPAGLFSITSTVTGGAITIYDNTAGSGTILFTKTLAVGDVIHWGGLGLAAKNGLYATVGAGTFVIAYT